MSPFGRSGHDDATYDCFWLYCRDLHCRACLRRNPYDGVWNVTILTRAGSCEPSARYPLTVTDGKVSGAADVSGSIGREGIVKVSIRGAYANGRLNGSGGSAAAFGKHHDSNEGDPDIAPQRNAWTSIDPAVIPRPFIVEDEMMPRMRAVDVGCRVHPC